MFSICGRWAGANRYSPQKSRWYKPLKTGCGCWTQGDRRRWYRLYTFCLRYTIPRCHPCQSSSYSRLCCCRLFSVFTVPMSKPVVVSLIAGPEAQNGCRNTFRRGGRCAPFQPKFDHRCSCSVQCRQYNRLLDHYRGPSNHWRIRCIGCPLSNHLSHQSRCNQVRRCCASWQSVAGCHHCRNNPLDIRQVLG